MLASMYFAHRRRLLWSVVCLLVPQFASADTYLRQPDVDALHYTFRLILSDTTDEIAGETGVDLRLLKDGLTTVTLDLASAANGTGMTVSDVSGAAGPLTFTHTTNKLTVTLPAPPRAGGRTQFTVRYRGVPASGLRIGANRHGERTFFGLNWPDKAREWLPVIDHPSDKATSEFIVTAPAHYQVVANGLLQEETDLPEGLRRTHWKQSVPISSWLATIGAARFAVHHAGTVQQVGLQTWVFSQDRDAGIRDFEAVSRRVMDFFSEKIGPYPYEKLANVQAAGLNGGTEHASAIFYGERSVTGQARIDGLVAHEIAHQWFGNSVTERDWDDVWLSEGFATYFTQLFIEHDQGRDAFVASQRQRRQMVLDFETRTPGYRIVHDNLADMTNVLSGQIYQKGGWTLHMLRGLMGTEPFWAGIREYYRRYRDANASTTEFRTIMEETSGLDLGWFFRQWLERGETPKLKGGWRYDAAAKQIQVDIEQTQPGEPFRLPLELAVRTAPAAAATGATAPGAAASNRTRPAATGTPPASAPAAPAQGAPRARNAAPDPVRIERIELRERRQTFTLASDTAPVDVTLDPNTWALMEATFVKR